jgi:hypothetical protein
MDYSFFPNRLIFEVGSGAETPGERARRLKAARAKVMAQSSAKRAGVTPAQVTAQIIPTPQPEQKTDVELIKDAAVPLKRLGKYLIGKLAKLPNRTIPISHSISVAMEDGRLVVMYSVAEFDDKRYKTGVLRTKIVFDGKTGEC